MFAKICVILAISSLALTQTPAAVNGCGTGKCLSCALDGTANKSCAACWKSVRTAFTTVATSFECKDGGDANCASFWAPTDTTSSGCMLCLGAFQPKAGTPAAGKTPFKCEAPATVVANCAAYIVSGCASCANNFVLVAGACVALATGKAVTNCVSYTGTADAPVCGGCANGFSLIGAVCTANTIGCAAGPDNTTCTSCQGTAGWWATDFKDGKNVCTKFAVALKTLTLIALAFVGLTAF
jgi:hypothetical protein